jgi:hypothetical protein
MEWNGGNDVCIYIMFILNFCPLWWRGCIVSADGDTYVLFWRGEVG